MDARGETVEIIREAFRYTQTFRDRTFVLQVDDSVVHDDLLPAIVRDLVLLHRAGIHIVLAAGARHRIDDILTRYGVSTTKHHGIRISSPEAIPFIKMAAFDVSNRIMTSLSGFGVNTVIGNWVKARSLGVVDGTDYQDAGTVDKVRADLINGVISQGSIPILPCIGWNAAGKPYNLSSRELATSLAVALRASKLFFVSAFDGLTSSAYQVDGSVESAPSGRISRMNIEQAKRFLELNSIPDDVGCELIRLAVRAAQGGVERVHLVDGRSDGAVLREIFSNLGVGTMVHADEYQSIRPMSQDDVPDVHRLMRPFIEKGLLVFRDEGDLSSLYGDYVVFETDGMVHGCCALHRYPADDGTISAEIAGLAVDPAFDHLGIGNRLVAYLIEKARAESVSRMFALTTQASDWFEQLGFRQGSTSDIPEGREPSYDPERASRVFVREI